MYDYKCYFFSSHKASLSDSRYLMCLFDASGTVVLFLDLGYIDKQLNLNFVLLSLDLEFDQLNLNVALCRIY